MVLSIGAVCGCYGMIFCQAWGGGDLDFVAGLGVMCAYLPLAAAATLAGVGSLIFLEPQWRFAAGAILFAWAPIWVSILLGVIGM